MRERSIENKSLESAGISTGTIAIKEEPTIELVTTNDNVTSQACRPNCYPSVVCAPRCIPA